MRYIISLIIAISLLIAPAYSADGFLSSRVKDISDRNYEKAVIELIDSAKESIVISMYSINIASGKRNPITLLLNDLLEARRRGVKVELYLNTDFRDIDENKNLLIVNPAIKGLEKAGCIIHLIPSNKMLHDKLVIVDKRYIAEGSTNWSISAFRRNFESSTLIDSSDLADIKLKRLKRILTLSKPKQKHATRPFYLEKLPKRLNIANELIINKKYFPQMVTRQDKRAFNLYLLLLAHSQLTKKNEFFLSLEDMGLSLGLPSSSTNTALRRQVIRSLKNLKSRYNLIDVEFFYGKNAIVIMSNLRSSSLRGSSEGATEAIISPNNKAPQSFTIPSDSIINDKDLTLRSKFLLLIKAYLKAEGGAEGDVAISIKALSERFGIDESVLRKARKDLEE